MRPVRVPVCLTWLALAAAPAAAWAQNTDQVFDAKGVPIRGTVVRVSPTAVDLDTGGGVVRSFEMNVVRRVTFGGEPGELQRAREAVEDGRFQDALDELAKIPAATPLTDPVRRDIAYYKAFAAGRLALDRGDPSQKNQAITLLLGYLKDNETSYHYFEACQLVADLAMATGNFKAAGEYYTKVGAAPWPEIKLRAAVDSGQALVGQGLYEDALKRFTNVTQAAAATPEANEQKLYATIGRAICLAETGQPAEGIALLEDLIAKNDPANKRLFGRACNALGRCHLKAGQPQDALLSYLKTDVLFFGEPDVHAEALYHLAQLWQTQNKADRATEARTLLKDRYGGSLWAARE